MNNSWFISRGLRVLQYQDGAITKVQESLKVREKTVLAACPSAGKTLMTTYILEEYLKENPTHNVIVLAHGTTILRTQFHDVLVQYKPDFTYALIESCTDYLNSTASVNVCLPQTLIGCNLRQTNLLIVDEAHHFYLSESATMVRNIIKKSKVKKQILLTGTPSKFIYENVKNKNDEYHIIPVTLNTIYDAGMVADLYVEVASSTYDFTLDDFNEYDELKSAVTFKSKQTSKTLDDLLEQIIIRLKSFRGNAYTNLTPDWGILLKQLKKTMIACKSIPQAKQVQKYLMNKGVNCALSTSKNDIESLEIERFKKEDDCLVLIVVYRGVLGFNFEKLVNVVDMTTSYNVDRIYQLFSRAIRIDKDNPDQKKLFFKIAPSMLTDYYKHIMTAVLMLSDEQFFTTFNGKNFDDMHIPVKRVPTSGGSSGGLSSSSTTSKARQYAPIDMEGLPVFEFFKNILHKKGELLTTYCMTTIKSVRAEFLNRMPEGYWTKERCMESALKYNTIKDWKINDSAAYAATRNYGWLDECTKHMIRFSKPDGYWTKEKCIEDGLKYDQKSKWQRNNNSAYSSAYKNDWLDECTKHMIQLQKPKGYWTKERCIESALKYNKYTDWTKNEGTAYNVAQKNDWLYECTKHMIQFKKPKGHWTKERCIKDALKYTNIRDWRKDSVSAYSIAKRNKWIEECTEHMAQLQKHKGYWIKERCMESALKYTTASNWRNNESSAYNAAYKNGWLEECIKHMISFSKPDGYWTKERCMESALKYNIISNWQRSERSAYGAAKNNGWFEECVEHMVRIKKPNGYWTKEKCMESALKYNTIRDWRKNEGTAYSSAKKNKWLDACNQHMIRLQKPNGYWTKEKCVEDALKYTTKKDWKKNSVSAYGIASKNGWWKECTSHMK